MSSFLAARSAFRATAFVGLIALSAACKPKPAPVPPPPPPPEAPAAVAVSGVEVGKAIGSDMRVISPMSTLGLRDTIYASVTTTGAASNASLGARWTFGADQLVDSTTVTIAPTGPAVTEFHIMRGSAWPKGSYAVTIFLNGQQAAQRQFEVK